MTTPRKSDHPGRPAAASPDRSVLTVPRRWLFGGFALLLLPWVIVAALYTRQSPPLTGDGGAVPNGPSRPASSGPWGRLTVTPIIVSPPLEYVAADWGRMDPDQYRWFFPGTSPDVLRAFLSSTGLTPDQIARLEATARPDERIRGLTIAPDLELLRGLTPDVRSRIYTQLARTHLNADQANSFRFFGGTADAWLAHSLISPQTRAVIEPLIYRDGDIMHFADAEIVLDQVTDAAERQKLAKVLLRQPTMLVRLSVDASSEVSALADYWGRGGRSTDVRPLLESVAAPGDDAEIDVIHLLPAFARNRLYRYPRLTAEDLNKPALVNCLWTSLNFFNEDPDDRFLDLNASLTELKTNYYIVESNYQLGDVIALLDGEGDLFHVVVYLADDLVFTKNGTSPVAPWTIMPLQRVKDYYRNQSQDPRLIYHRRNIF
jgi:hypothetical protein